jgi:alkylation response protein AidB-like acyl-CoA dehydrogenase
MRADIVKEWWWNCCRAKHSCKCLRNSTAGDVWNQGAKGRLATQDHQRSRENMLRSVGSPAKPLDANAYRTEPNTGSATLKLKTVAKKDGDKYLISGQKMYLNLL